MFSLSLGTPGRSVQNPRLREKLWDVLQIMLNEKRQAWDLQPDGSYVQRKGPDTELGTHQMLMNSYRNPGPAIAALVK